METQILQAMTDEQVINALFTLAAEINSEVENLGDEADYELLNKEMEKGEEKAPMIDLTDYSDKSLSGEPLSELNLLKYNLSKEKLAFNIEIDKKLRQVDKAIEQKKLDNNLKFDFAK